MGQLIFAGRRLWFWRADDRLEPIVFHDVFDWLQEGISQQVSQGSAVFVEFQALLLVHCILGILSAT